jgi:hypothetical protein
MGAQLSALITRPASKKTDLYLWRALRRTRSKTKSSEATQTFAE